MLTITITPELIFNRHAYRLRISYKLGNMEFSDCDILDFEYVADVESVFDRMMEKARQEIKQAIPAMKLGPSAFAFCVRKAAEEVDKEPTR